MGWQELLIILFILLLIFGAGRLTGLGSALGRTVREFRDATDDDRNAQPSEPKPEPNRTSGGDTTR